MRFRQALLAHGLEAALFEAITAQLKARAVRVKTGTIVDASVVASASEDDGEAAWSGHRSRKAVHGYKAHVGADADSALVERIAVTPGNRHDGRCGDLALPEAPGEVYADSGYRGEVFAAAVRAKGGTPRVVVTSVWCLPYEDPAEKLAAWNGPIHRIRGRIEKIFGTWKRSYGFRRMRWRGLAKAALQLSLTAIAYNLRRTANILAAA